MVFLFKTNNLPAKLRVGWRSYGSEGVEELNAAVRIVVAPAIETIRLSNPLVQAETPLTKIFIFPN